MNILAEKTDRKLMETGEYSNEIKPIGIDARRAPGKII